MKKSLLTVFAMATVLTASSQVSDGYYRVKNLASQRYITVVDTHGAKNIQAGTADLLSCRTVKNFENVESDPASVIYVKKVSGSSNLYDFECQTANTFNITGYHLNLTHKGGGIYWASGTAYGFTKYLGDRSGSSVYSVMTQYESAMDNYYAWQILPITSTSTDNYFGLKPAISLGGKYYAPFLADFSYELASSGMKAYYVSAIDKELGVAVFQEVSEGKVPRGVGVYVECSSTEPASNRLNITYSESTGSLSGNRLTGLYFNNIALDDKGNPTLHNNYVKYTEQVMNTTRMLRVTKSGKLGFVKVPIADSPVTINPIYPNINDHCLPRNEAYLTVDADCPDELVLMSQTEYEAYKQANSKLVIKVNDATRSYGDANPTFTYTVVSGTKQGGEPVITTTATQSSPVGTYAITATKGGVTNGQFEAQPGTLTVTKAPLTITARSYTIRQDEALPVFAADFAGFKNGETSSVLAKQPTFNTNAPADKKPGTYTITASGAEAQNYSISYVPGTLTITEAPLITIKAEAKTMVYGDDVPQLTYSVTGGTLSGTPRLTTTATKTSDVGEYDIVVSTEGLTYPNLAVENAKLTITKAPVTVTARSYSIVEIDNLPTFVADYAGWKNGQNESVLTKQPTLSCNAPADKTPGTYTITASGAEAKNYSFTYVNGTLAITQAPYITIKANAKTMVYGDDLPELTYEITGGTLNGTPLLTTIATKTSDAGEYAIVVEKGDITYPRLTLVNASLTITKAPVTVTARSYSIVETDNLPTFAADYAGWKNGQNESVLTKQPTLSCNVPTDKAPGTYTITASGAEAKNYSFTYVNGTLTITEAATITIRAIDATAVYGDGRPELTYVVEGGELTGTPVLVCEASAQPAAGQYDITVERGSIAYPRLQFVGAKLTITKASLNISVGNYTVKQSDRQLPEFELTYSGFKYDDTAESLATQPIVSTEAVAGGALGEYPIVVSGAESSNYEISYTNGKLTIVEADAIIITVADTTMTYGDSVPEFKFTVVGGDIEGMPAISCEATSASDAGEYAITIAVGTIDYPNLVLVPGTLTIEKAVLTVTALDASREEGEENPVFELTYDGWRNGDTVDSLDVVPVATTEATVESPVGEYEIVVSNGEAKNYSFIYVNGKLFVTEKDAIAALVLSRPADVYTTSGRKVRSQATTLRGLPAGIYIVNGRKVVVR